MDEPGELIPGIVDRYADSGMNLTLKKALTSVQILWGDLMGSAGSSLQRT
jgi:hypothetical protein